MSDKNDNFFERAVDAQIGKRLRESEDFYKQFLILYPEHPDASHNLGVLFLQAKVPGKSLQYFVNALVLDPTKIQFWVSYIDVLIRLEKISKASDVLVRSRKSGIAIDPEGKLSQRVNKKLLEEEIKKLIFLYNRRSFDNVIKYGIQLPKKFKNNHIILNIIGAAYTGLGRYDESLEYYWTAIATHSTYPDAYNNLANSLNRLKQIKMAHQLLKKALILRPFYPEALQNFADIVFDQANYKQAANLFKRLLFKNKRDPDLEYKVALVHKKLCQFETAIELFDQCRFGDYEAQILECLHQSGRKDDLQQQLNKFTESNPTDVNIAALSNTIHKLASQKDPYPFCPCPLNYIKIDHLGEELPNWECLVNDLLISIERMNLIWEPKFKATIGGEQTDNGLFAHQGRHITTLKEVIRKRAGSYFEYFKKSNSLFIRNHPSNIELQGWFVRMNQGGFQQSHIHSSGWVSGIVYLKTIDDPFTDQGAIEFGRAVYDFTSDNDNQEVFIHKPKPGEIIFFPSSLFHRTIPINSQKERCIISFDVFPKKTSL
jgi:tetratricopeptide (TPR) repeat protein